MRPDHEQLAREVTSFYDRWHRFERTLGRDDGQILDFDMAPRADRSDAPPFESRLAALRALSALRGQVDASLPYGVYLAAKLRGAEAYLRALMGERIDFETYLSATMGLAKSDPRPRDWIPSQAEQLAEEFAARGVPWAPEGRARYRAVFGRSAEGFEGELRHHAETWLGRVGKLLDRPVAPQYAIEVVHEDAYWTNWIDGSVETGVRLRVNTHSRTEYVVGSSLVLAAHEIAGHAMHVSLLRAEAEAARVPRWALNLTVHACEAFHMEGLAQCVLHLAPPGELPADVLLLDRHGAFRNEVVNAAQIQLERGEKIDDLLDWVGRTCPLANPAGIASDLRDRSRHPLYRSYVHVYAPARRVFMRAAALSEAGRRRFFSRAYTTLMTPAELSELIEACEADERAAPAQRRPS